MPINTTSNGPTNSVRARYEEKYFQSAAFNRQYDQFAVPASADKEKLQRGSSVVLNFIGDLDIATAAISQTTDITPKQLYDATVSITPTSLADGIQDSEQLMLQHYTDYAAKRYEVLGKQQALSVDNKALEAMLQGSLVDRAAARASLDAGTAAHRLADSDFAKIEARLSRLKVPMFVNKGGGSGKGQVPPWLAMMGPEVYYDLRSSGNVQSVALYQDKRIILNNELGELGAFRIVVSPWAKTFGAAGADNGTAVGTTLALAAKPLDKTVEVAADTNIAAGQKITIGTEETGSTFYPLNEEVEVISIASTTVTIAGSGANGGLMFNHSVGEGFRNADNVYTVAYGGPGSIAKVYAKDVGEFGKVVGPRFEGMADQWVTLAWKWYGGYGRISESWLIRGEYSSSLDA